MPDDVKKILSDLENGRLPDIKRNSGNKELTKVRYNRSYRKDGAKEILESTACYSFSESEGQRERDYRYRGSIATKERKKSKPEGE